MSAERVTHTLVCSGLVLDRHGKTFIRLHRIDDEGNLSNGLLWTHKPSKNKLSAGHVYQIQGNAEVTELVLGGAKWVCEYEDKTLVTRWQSETVSVKLQVKQAALEKKLATSDSRLSRLMLELRSIHNNMQPQDRTAFVAYVITQMRG